MIDKRKGNCINVFNDFVTFNDWRAPASIRTQFKLYAARSPNLRLHLLSTRKLRLAFTCGRGRRRKCSVKGVRLF